MENEGKNIEENDSGGIKPKDKNPQINISKNINEQDKSNDGEQECKDNSEDNNVDMEEESTPNDNINHEPNCELAGLKEENKTLNEQLEKLKRVVYNMNKEMKAKTG